VGGAGLGLAISRGIVAAHGGRLELSAGGETGSTFTMTLDTVEPDVAAPVIGER
jgi:signal transduction histidine kinase